MDRLLNLLTVLSAVLVVLVLATLRRAHIRVEYSVSWLGGALALLILSRARGTLETASAYVGIDSPPLALLLAVGCVFVVIFFRFSVMISKLKDDNVALAQRVAILEFRLKSSQTGEIC